MKLISAAGNANTIIATGATGDTEIRIIMNDTRLMIELTIPNTDCKMLIGLKLLLAGLNH